MKDNPGKVRWKDSGRAVACEIKRASSEMSMELETWRVREPEKVRTNTGNLLAKLSSSIFPLQTQSVSMATSTTTGGDAIAHCVRTVAMCSESSYTPESRTRISARTTVTDPGVRRYGNATNAAAAVTKATAAVLSCVCPSSNAEAPAAKPKYRATARTWSMLTRTHLANPHVRRPRNAGSAAAVVTRVTASAIFCLHTPPTEALAGAMKFCTTPKIEAYPVACGMELHPQEEQVSFHPGQKIIFFSWTCKETELDVKISNIHQPSSHGRHSSRKTSTVKTKEQCSGNRSIKLLKERGQTWAESNAATTTFVVTHRDPCGIEQRSRQNDRVRAKERPSRDTQG